MLRLKFTHNSHVGMDTIYPSKEVFRQVLPFSQFIVWCPYVGNRKIELVFPVNMAIKHGHEWEL